MNLSMTRGDQRTFTMALTAPNGSPLDLTDFSLTFTAKLRLTDDDSEAVFQKTLGAGITVATPTSGIATVTIDPEDTEDVGGRVLVWDLQVEDGDDVRTPLLGRLRVTRDVTRTSGAGS